VLPNPMADGRHENSVKLQSTVVFIVKTWVD